MTLPANRVSRRAFLRGSLALGAAFAVSGVGGSYYVLGVEPHRLEISRVSVPLPGLPPGLSGLRIAHLTDIHLGRWVSREQLRMAVDLALAAEPDLIALTGDFVSSVQLGEPRVLVEALARCTRAPLGACAVLGNHDHWTSAETVREALRVAGVSVLDNASRPLTHNGERLYVAGVDDVWEGHADLARALAGVPEGGFVVLLAHEPDYADVAATERRVRLQLSGHSHGGQVNLPGVPRVLPYMGTKYPEGLRRVQDAYVYTSRGVGVVTPPVRLNCPPEVALIELTAAP